MAVQVSESHNIKYNGTVPRPEVHNEAEGDLMHHARQQTGNELGAGACAGIIAMSATYPMDMVRGRLTVQTDKSPYQYREISASIHCFHQEGPQAIQGLAPFCHWSCSSSLFTFMK
ncbi:hypothetical protein Leryth_022003 [Lithospermum erythrorhizon]|nr:hypothetical protein Leryth_022003 [Lithospermum erythrorhizon]